MKQKREKLMDNFGREMCWLWLLEGHGKEAW